MSFFVTAFHVISQLFRGFLLHHGFGRTLPSSDKELFCIPLSSLVVDGPPLEFLAGILKFHVLLSIMELLAKPDMYESCQIGGLRSAVSL